MHHIKRSKYIANRPFAEIGHMVQNKLCWDANNTVGHPKQRNSYQSSPTFPLHYLRPSIIYSVPCDQIVQMAHFTLSTLMQISPVYDNGFALRHALKQWKSGKGNQKWLIHTALLDGPLGRKSLL